MTFTRLGRKAGPDKSLFTLTGATAWRHPQQLPRGRRSPPRTPLNIGDPCDAVGDLHLRAALTTRALRVEEEHVLPDFLADLSAHARAW